MRCRFYQASSSEMFGKVARGAAERGDAVPSAQPVRASARCSATGSRATTARRTACTPSTGSCSTTSRHGAATTLRHAQDHARCRRHPARRAAASSRSATSRRSATGASRATTWKARGRCCSRTSPTTSCSRRARRTRSQEFLEEAFGYAGLDWRDYVQIDPRYFRPAEVDAADRRLLEGEGEARLGAEGALRGARADDGRRRPRREPRALATTRSSSAFARSWRTRASTRSSSARPTTSSTSRTSGA